MKKIKFPQKLKFDLLPKTEFMYNTDLDVQILDWPQTDYKTLVYNKVMATWEDKFRYLFKGDIPKDELNKTFMDVLKFKTLPNSLEAIKFDFVVNNIPLVEITHLLRHRSFYGIHAQCTGDRDLRNDGFFIPDSVFFSRFRDEYDELHKRMLQLYCKMVDSMEVSFLDARYCLPRSSTYFYYFSANLKDLIAFIKQRRCTMVQPKLDVLFAKKLLKAIISVIPEVGEVVKPECDISCHYINAKPDKNTRLFQPDENHKKLMEMAGKNWTTIYNKPPF